MPININSENLIRKSYYSESEITNGLNEIPKESKKQIVRLGNSQREFRVVTAELDYNKLGTAKLALWKFGRGLEAFVATVFTLGFALLIPAVRNLWKEAATGKELREIKLLTPGAAASYTAVQVDAVRQNTMPNQQSQPPNTGGVNPPRPQNTAPSTTHTRTQSTPATRDFTPIIPLTPDPVSVEPLPSILHFHPSEKSPLLENARFIDPIKYEKESSKFRGMDLKKWQSEVKRGMIYTTPTFVKDLDLKLIERIKQYNDAIRLQERLFAMKDQFHIDYIKIADLEDPWEVSGLKIALLTKEEVANLTVEQIQEISKNERQLAVLRNRLDDIADGEPLSAEITTENFKNIKLSVLRGVPGNELNFYLGQIPGKMVALLKKEQLDQLDINKLDDEQFKFMFNDVERLQKLPVEYLVKNLTRFERVLPDQLSALAEDQVKSLKFGAGSPVTPGILKLIGLSNYSTKPERSLGHLIKCLKTEQIIDGLNNDLFIPETASSISAEQIKQINFKKVTKFDDDVFRTMFSSYGKVASIQLESLNILVPHIIPERLNRLTKEQVKTLDFSKEGPITPEILNGMLESRDNIQPNIAYGHVIQFLDPQQIVDGLIHGTLTKEASTYITREQIAKTDFKPVKNIEKNPELKPVIQAMFSYYGKVASIPLESLNILVPHIFPERLNRLTKEQVKTLDFSKEGPITPEILNGMLESRDTIQPTIAYGHVIQFLDPQQIVDGLIHGTLTKEASTYITREQIAKTDFKPVKNIEKNPELKPVIQAMFSYYGKVASIQLESLNILVPHIIPERLNRLTKDQVKTLDFSKEGPITPEILNGMLEARDTIQPTIAYGHVIQFLTSEQIIAALNRSVFNDSFIFYITNNQLRDLNLNVLGDSPQVQKLKDRKAKL